jgi:hypothetical protein
MLGKFFSLSQTLIKIPSCFLASCKFTPPEMDTLQRSLSQLSLVHIGSRVSLPAELPLETLSGFRYDK